MAQIGKSGINNHDRHIIIRYLLNRSHWPGNRLKRAWNPIQQVLAPLQQARFFICTGLVPGIPALDCRYTGIGLAGAEIAKCQDQKGWID